MTALFIIAIPHEGLASSDFNPALLLDPAGLADDVDPGDVVARIGDVTIFWLDEFYERGKPTNKFDDAVRFALWRTDGTPMGTYPLLPPQLSFFSSKELDETLIFLVCRTSPSGTLPGVNCDPPHDRELWRTDGTRDGTYPLLDKEGRVWLSGSSSALLPGAGGIFFVRTFGDFGMELWVTDGTKDGTRMVRDLEALGLRGSGALTAWGNRLYFLGTKVVGDETELWVGRSDGTSSGTTIFPARIPDLGFVQSFISAGEHLYLVAAGEERPHPVTEVPVRARTLWVLERGTDEFRKLVDLGYRRTHTNVHAVAGNGRLFLEFPSYPGEGYEVWATDGTSIGTQRLGHVSKLSVLGHIWTEPFTLPMGGALLGLSLEPGGGEEPWVSTGETARTELLLDLCQGECSSFPVGMTVFGAWFYFSAEDESTGRELWRWHPASGAVERVADFCPGECGAYPILVDETADRLFVRAIDSDFRWRVWQIGADGSAEEVTDFGDLRLGGFEFLGNRGIHWWRISGDRAVFWATDGKERLGLWSMQVPPMDPLPPPGPGLTSEERSGFSVKVRINAGAGESIAGRQESSCIPETMCVSGALAGRSEVFIRVVGPKPNGRLWPTLVKFTTSTVEVWIEQLSTGIVKYYRLEGATAGDSDLPGLFDRDGFPPNSGVGD